MLFSGKFHVEEEYDINYESSTFEKQFFCILVFEFSFPRDISAAAKRSFHC